MMIYVIIGFLWVSLLIYLIMGGADFGTGILELFSPAERKSHLQKTSYEAIGPIWEANHMWLIIAAVILFVGFPAVYTTMCVYLHIPLLIMLLGIIARGTAFTFRNYDAVKDGMQKIYNRIYAWSSFITPLFLGIISASAISMQIKPKATDFYSAYIYSWLNLFSISIGFFTVALCSFLAAVYLLGKVDNRIHKLEYISRAKIANLTMLFFVSVTFFAAGKENIPLADWVFANLISRIAMGIAFICFVFLWIAIYKDRIILTRLLGVLMITSLLVTVTFSHYPNIVLFNDGSSLSLLRDKAPDVTIGVLGSALLLGSLLILPSLFYLVKSFGNRHPH